MKLNRDVKYSSLNNLFNQPQATIVQECVKRAKSKRFEHLKKLRSTERFGYDNLANLMLDELKMSNNLGLLDVDYPDLASEVSAAIQKEYECIDEELQYMHLYIEEDEALANSELCAEMVTDDTILCPYCCNLVLECIGCSQKIFIGSKCGECFNLTQLKDIFATIYYRHLHEFHCSSNTTLMFHQEGYILQVHCAICALLHHINLE